LIERNAIYEILDNKLNLKYHLERLLSISEDIKYNVKKEFKF